MKPCVLFFSQSVLDVGGIERYITQVVLSLQDQYRFVVAGPLSARFKASFGDAELTFENVPRRGKLSVATVRDVARLIQKYRPCVLHAVEPRGRILAHSVAKALGVPGIVTMQITTDSYGYKKGRQRFYDFIEAFFNDHVSSHVMFVSEHDLTRAGTPARGSVVHNSVDVAALERLTPSRMQLRRARRLALRLAPETTVVVSVGRLAYQKAPEQLVEAAAALREANVPPFAFVLVGEGEERPKVEAAIRAHHLEDIVHLVGAQPEASVNAWLMAADVFALASRFECFPLSILEACAAGLPCVVTDVGGNRESVQEGQNGFVVPPERPDLMARVLRPLLEEPARRAEMGARARDIARTFRVERMAAQVAERYDALCARHP